MTQPTSSPPCSRAGNRPSDAGAGPADAADTAPAAIPHPFSPQPCGFAQAGTSIRRTHPNRSKPTAGRHAMAAIRAAGHEDAKVNEQSNETNTHKEKNLEYSHDYTDHRKE